TVAPLGHLRIARHYIQTAVLLVAITEGLLLVTAPYIGSYIRYGEFPTFTEHLLPSVTFAVVLVLAMLSMGVYEARIREGFSGMMLRTAVAVFLLGAMATAVLSYVLPSLAIHRSVLLLSAISAFVLLTVWRWL